MGEIVGAALVSHIPPIVWPDAERIELYGGVDTSLVAGLHRLRTERLDRLRPDTVIVFDTHWFTTVEHIVSAHDRRTGLFTSDELPRAMHDVAYDMPGDPELAHAMAVAGGGSRRHMDPRLRRAVAARALPDDQPARVPPG